MALTKTQLKEILSAAGISAENAEVAIGKIMDGHVASINALREDKEDLQKEVAKYKEDAEKLADVQKELDGLKAKGDPDWQKKYEDEHTAFEEFKSAAAKEKETEQKTALYRKLLAECNIDKKRIDAVIKVTDIDKLTVKDGQLDNLDALKADIKKEWSGFIMSERKQGAEVDNPPDNNGGEGKGKESRAAQLEKAYHENLYGETKKGD